MKHNPTELPRQGRFHHTALPTQPTVHANTQTRSPSVASRVNTEEQIRRRQSRPQAFEECARATGAGSLDGHMADLYIHHHGVRSIKHQSPQEPNKIRACNIVTSPEPHIRLQIIFLSPFSSASKYFPIWFTIFARDSDGLSR